MSDQIIEVGGSGADSRRVLEALTPKVGTSAPSENADFVGQIFVNTDGPTIYISVATDSVSAADDWVEIQPAT